MEKTAHPAKNIPHIAVTVLLMLLALIPFYSLLVMALSSQKWTGVLAPQWYFGNFAAAWNSSHLGRAMANSLILTVCAMLMLVACASMAGYAFARNKDLFHKISFNVFLFSMLFPTIIITVPLYTLMKQIHGINTYWAMILLLTTGVLPFSIFLYASFIKGMSHEIEEAAYIDGCSRYMTFWRIVFPLLKPVTSSVVILNAVGVWNNYGTAIFFLQRQEMQTVPLAIASFQQTYGANWNLMAAAALIGMLPPVVVFLSFQKYFIKGIAAGSVKG